MPHFVTATIFKKHIYDILGFMMKHLHVLYILSDDLETLNAERFLHFSGLWSFTMCSKTCLLIYYCRF